MWKNKEKAALSTITNGKIRVKKQNKNQSFKTEFGETKDLIGPLMVRYVGSGAQTLKMEAAHLPLPSSW